MAKYVQRRGRVRAVALLALSAIAVLIVIGAAPAYAGEWWSDSCENPNYTAAPSQGWTSFTTGTPGNGSDNSTKCSPGNPMFAALSMDAAVKAGSSEDLQYTPPGGSTLIGGQVDVALYADGRGYGASGAAVVYSPELAYNNSNVFFQCVAGSTPCANGTNDFAGVLGLPTNRGGNLYISAACGGNANAICDEGGSEGDWARVGLWWANLLLENGSTPTASNFGGPLLEPNAHGTADLRFTAGDPNGPGVYSVTLQIDGHVVYQDTPERNDGHCAAVDSISGVLMFDYQQPCKQRETVDIPVNTTTTTDGKHALTVMVTDAAQNSSVVYDGTITTMNSSPNSVSPDAETYAIILDKRTGALGKNVRRPYDHSALTLSGQLRDIAGTLAPGVSISLVARDGRPPAGNRVVLGRTTTNAAGEWVLHAPKGPSRQLQVLYGAVTASRARRAVTITETVRPSLTLHVATPGGQNIVFSGRLEISPITPPRPLVTIETRTAHEWEAVGHAIRVNKNGIYRYVFHSSPFTLGRRFVFRAQTPETGLWQADISPTPAAVIH